jgi:hypothetical protein
VEWLAKAKLGCWLVEFSVSNPTNLLLIHMVQQILVGSSIPGGYSGGGLVDC